MTHLLVVGAGVAGTALAAWLDRYGIDVTLLEKSPAPRPGGQGIDVRGAARDVVERLGVLDQVRAAHTGVRGIRQVDAAGRVRVEMGAERLGHSGGIVADLEILRSDLVRILDGAVGDVERIYGDSVTDLVDDADGVTVTLESGGTRRFDAVVGADGLFSRVRRLRFPEARLHECGYHRAVFTVTGLDAADLPGADGWELMHSMPAGNGTTLGRNVMLYPAHHGVRAMVHWEGGPALPDRHDVAAQKRVVAQVLDGEGWHVPAVLRGLWSAEDFYCDRPARVETPWQSGRVALLGDSCAGGSVGMGTSIALVGAYVLAGELAAAGGDPLAALPAYEALVRPYAEANMKPMPGGAKGFLPATERSIRTQQAFMRWMLRTPLAPLMMGGMDKAVEAIELPEDAPTLTR